MQAACAELRAQFGGNNERFSDCWLSQDEGRSWSQQLETPPWAARWGMGMAALPSGALVLARGFGVHNESLADKFLTISAVEKHHSILGNYILLRRQVSLRRHVGSASRPGA